MSRQVKRAALRRAKKTSVITRVKPTFAKGKTYRNSGKRVFQHVTAS
ncbi:hypothetical protein QBC99_002466 [Beijerinckia sp. GAS462]|nr:hypothetical protein [Beijerinckia sp. GAS462]SEC43626.1 hypothetical protein SAMN05443249_2685 [Beijerinckia sp. 28-YEA-48]